MTYHAVIIFTQMMNSDQIDFFFFYTTQKHLQRARIRAMYRLSYHFRLTLPFLPAIPNRVNLNLLSPEQALCQEFVINPDLSIKIHCLSNSPDGYTDVGDVNTGRRKIDSCSSGKAGERSLQRLMFEHLKGSEKVSGVSIQYIAMMRFLRKGVCASCSSMQGAT